MDILLIIISIGVSITSLFPSLVAIAGGDGGNSATTPGLGEAHELSEMQRESARRLVLLAAWGSVFLVAAIPVSSWTAMHSSDGLAPDAPWWFTVWLLLGLAAAYHFVRVVALLFQCAGLLRDRNTLRMRDFFRTLFGSAFQQSRHRDERI